MNDVGTDLPDTAVCLQCRYPLRGLPTPVCPRCGRAFEPGDSASFGDPARERSRLRPRFARPPQAWHRWTVALLTGYALIDMSSPGSWFAVGYIFTCAAFPLYVIIAADYALRVLFALTGRQRRTEELDGGLAANDQSNPARRRRSHWVVTPVCLFLLASSIAYPWPAWARFTASRGALQELVSTRRDVRQPEWVGLFPVQRTKRYDDGSVFVETGNVYIESWGFLYCPTGKPTPQRALHVMDALAPAWFLAAIR